MTKTNVCFVLTALGVALVPASPALIASAQVANCFSGLGIAVPSGIRVVTGTAGRDTIDLRGQQPALVLAGAGDDRIYGSSGVDYICGDDGADKIYAYAGADYVSGGTGNDYVQGGAGDDYVNGNQGSDVIYGGAQRDTESGFFGLGRDNLHGGRDDDYVDGNDGDDRIYGELGQDLLFGACGNDLVDGGDGNDDGTFNGLNSGLGYALYGDFTQTFYPCNNGLDTLIGGPGLDEGDGGGGVDSCQIDPGETRWANCP